MQNWENIVELPDVLTFLCVGDDNYQLNNQSIIDYIAKEKFLFSYLTSIFQKQSEKLSLDSALNSYGVKGFRDRIASIYLEKLESGKFPSDFKLDHTLDLIDFEKRFSDFTLSNNYRTYMLAFFLKLYNESQFNQGKEEIIVPITVDEILLTGKSREHKIDWIILGLTIILRFLDTEIIKSEMNGNNVVFSNLINKLNDEQQSEFLTVMILYANSIQDLDSFKYNKV